MNIQPAKPPHPEDVSEVMKLLNCTRLQAVGFLNENDNDPIQTVYGKPDLISCPSCGHDYSMSEEQLDAEFVDKNWVCYDCEVNPDSEDEQMLTN